MRAQFSHSAVHPLTLLKLGQGSLAFLLVKSDLDVFPSSKGPERGVWCPQALHPFLSSSIFSFLIAVPGLFPAGRGCPLPWDAAGQLG